MQAKGAVVREADSFDQAKDRLRESAFDVVFLDLHSELGSMRYDSLALRPALSLLAVPHENGFDILNQVRKDDAFRHIPVVLMSSDFRGVQGIRWGASDFLQKPLEKSEIERAAQECVSGSEDEGSGLHRVLCVDDDVTVTKTLQ